MLTSRRCGNMSASITTDVSERRPYHPSGVRLVAFLAILYGCYKGMTKRLFILIMVMAVASGALGFFLWRKESNRKQCIMNLEGMHIAIYSQAGMENSFPGDTVQGGAKGLLERSHNFEGLPKCPSGGDYAFWSDVTYSLNGRDNVRCSCAESKGHVLPDGWPKDYKSPP